jgi:hypothetical protein
MTSVNCETLTPPGLEVVEGRRVYRSTHIVTVLNDTGENILYNVEAIRGMATIRRKMGHWCHWPKTPRHNGSIRY